MKKRINIMLTLLLLALPMLAQSAKTGRHAYQVNQAPQHLQAGRQHF